ncbi:ATP-binding protein [Paractinoplanes lichenicola]|uniref:ATP-binding protein n=1 Tax=Paractinoplanes lichenicola TaxID=2802976 RepID=A0ABS1VUT8_9ACTN|nr:ATP-binding protein [Actinoplanes lichenicola]MBL7258248.1 ATP-binding protein [Actinoplanes lichenicola]
MENNRWPVMRGRHALGRLERRDASGAVAVTADAESAVTLVTVRGTWGSPLRRDTFTAVKKVLSEHPIAMVIDLCEVIDTRAASVSTWLTVSRVGAAMEPPVRVAACLPRRAALTQRLDRLGSPYFLPVFENPGLARAAVVAGGPITDRLRLDLPPHPDSPALARNLVSEACSAWGLPEVLYPARLVMSELAANAVEHAGTPFRVVVVRRGSGLHLIVTDGEPRMPHLVDPPEDPPGNLWDIRGQGLRTVQAASAGWGALPTRNGKMVWATVKP